MDRRDSTSTASTETPSVFSPASPNNKRRHISSDETDPTSISNEIPSHNTPKPPRPSPSPTRPHKMAHVVNEDSEDEHRRQAFRTPFPSEPGPWEQIRTFAIEPDHPLVPHWPRLRDALIAALDQQSLLCSWRALEVFRRRRTIRPSPPGTDDTTVVVTIDKGADEGRRATLIEMIKAICVANEQPTLEIEVLEGSIARLATSSRLPYEKITTLGSSVGVGGLDWCSGTLGGFVTLRSPSNEEVICCALTCHHVLRPTRPLKHAAAAAAASSSTAATSPPPQSTPPYDPDLDVIGRYHPSVDKADPSLRIEQPCTADHQIERKYLVSQIAELDSRIADYEREVEMGMDTERRQLGNEVTRKRREISRRLLADIDSFDRTIGHVWATSGYRIASSGCAIDWGLVRIDKERFGFNELPELPASHATMRLGGKKVTMTAKMRLGDDLLMFGKSSGMTRGTFSAIESSIHWPELEDLTTEYVVTGRDGLAFSASGDSGAFVLNLSGSLVGLLMGGVEGKGTGYVTPIETVWDDIRTRTGHEIELD